MRKVIHISVRINSDTTRKIELMRVLKLILGPIEWSSILINSN